MSKQGANLGSEKRLPVLILVPSGTYQVGLSQELSERLVETSDQARRWYDKGYFKREQPQHKVSLTDFYLGKYPVTVDEYGRFIKAGGYEDNHFWSPAAWQWRLQNNRTQPAFWNDPGGNGDVRLPVIGVSWYEAQAYGRWLSATSGRSYRLPTEFEWEAAARGPGSLLYPWGDEFDSSRCNYSASGFRRPSAVGHFSPAGDGSWGHADMAGNVSEWTASPFQPYPVNHHAANDEGANLERVTRGGSWFSPVLRLRCTARGYNDPGFSDNDLGFRLASDG